MLRQKSPDCSTNMSQRRLIPENDTAPPSRAQSVAQLVSGAAAFGANAHIVKGSPATRPFAISFNDDLLLADDVIESAFDSIELPHGFPSGERAGQLYAPGHIGLFFAADFISSKRAL